MTERKKQPDEKFCTECGEIIRLKAEICPKCGCRQPGMYQPNPIEQAVNPSSPKSRTTAAALAVLLGGIGAHKFYLGKPILGICYAIFVFTFLPAIIGLVEGIHYLTMTDNEFDIRYRTGKLEVVGWKQTP